MKNKHLFAALLISCTIFIAKAQKIMCGYDIGLQSMEAKHPGYIEAYRQVFQNIKHNAKQSDVARNDIIEVPVVVHIVWKYAKENLHDSIIASQINALNETFNLQNANRDNVRDIFKHLQGNAQIRFKLHAIKRAKTTEDFEPSLFGLPDHVKKTDSGGSDALDPDKFINIWVCKLQPFAIFGGQVFGYSYPPGGLPNWPENVAAPEKALDGLVIDFRAFGANNPNEFVVGGEKIELKDGMTTVHEMGHYFGLRHIWGDGTDIFSTDSCAEDDGIDDTPNQGQESDFDCNLAQNTCDDGVNDLPDLIENYMDYSAESCQCMFTKQQIGFMRNVIITKRKLLVGTSDISSEDIFQIRPNPVVDQLHIRLGDTRDYYVKIFNDLGQLQLEIKNQNNIDISGLAKGLYVCHVSQNNIVSKKIFVKI